MIFHKILKFQNPVSIPMFKPFCHLVHLISLFIKGNLIPIKILKQLMCYVESINKDENFIEFLTGD